MLRPLDRDRLRKEYTSAQPFPYFAIDNFLTPEAAREVAGAYPSFETAESLGFQFNFVNERRKIQVTDSKKFPDAVARLHGLLSSPEFLADMSYITGIPNLLADPQLVGGGMHLTGPGGRLDVHVDFNYIEERKLHRRLNILVFLNPDWKVEWGGQLELWDQKVERRHHAFEPVLNRCVVFETSEVSYHGVCPVTCPPDVVRRSFAAYYYTSEAPATWKGVAHSTVFKARPHEFIRGALLMPAERFQRELKERIDEAKGKVKGKVKSWLLG